MIEEKNDAEENMKFDWPPLESDPDIFNNYFHSIGLSDKVFFKELLSLLDYKEFLLIEGPLLGIMLNYSRVENKKNEPPEDKILLPEKIPYFIKQTDVLDNACGLIAALHIFGNNKIDYIKNSILDEFFINSKKLNYEERAKFLENYNKFKEAHKEFSNKGQTKMEDVEKKKINVGHYISFVIINDNLYELDGIKKGPFLLKENINYTEFLDETSKIIMKRIENKEIDENVNVMIVYDDKSLVTDFLAEE
jgi:hypothetical protein